MKKIIVLVLFLFTIQLVVVGQNSNRKGIIFAWGGLNRSGYLPTMVSVETPGYNYSLQNVQLSDNAEAVGIGNFFSSSSPQFSIALGYFVAKKWAVVAGFDRFNSFFVNGQQTTINGTFSPGSHPYYVGHVNDDFELSRDQFAVTQTGMNFISIGVQRNDEVYKSRWEKFAIQTLYGLRIGGIFTSTNYTYNGETTNDISSLSGIGVALNVGVKFDFVKYIFLQVGLSTGWLHQGNIKLSQDGELMAKQSTGYLSPRISLGFSIPGGEDDCNTCPQW